MSIVCWGLLTTSVVPCRALSSADSFQHVLLQQGNQLYPDCQVTLLPSAREKYADMFRTIREARHYVHLEYFIFHLDSIGGQLLDLLTTKVQEGVEVRLLIDAYGNYKSDRPITESELYGIRQRGIRVDMFDPLHFPWIGNVLHRDHRKIVVVDGLYAYTGGMNVADYYLHGTKKTGPWRDMQVRLQGSVVNGFEGIFERIWWRTTGEILDTLAYRAQHPSVPDGCSVVIVNREPGAASRQIRRAYVAALESAREEVCIINPYPTNTHSVRRAMKQALRRGVSVRIMVSASSDNRIVPEVIAIQMKKFMKHGAEIYYFEGGFHHSKLLMLDGEVCSVGTANLDGRSLRYDYEVNAFIFSPEVTRQLHDIFDADVKCSERLTPETFKRRFSLRQRIVGRLFQPIKGLL